MREQEEGTSTEMLTVPEVSAEAGVEIRRSVENTVKTEKQNAILVQIFFIITTT